MSIESQGQYEGEAVIASLKESLKRFEAPTRAIKTKEQPFDKWDGSKWIATESLSEEDIKVSNRRSLLEIDAKSFAEMAARTVVGGEMEDVMGLGTKGKSFNDVYFEVLDLLTEEANKIDLSVDQKNIGEDQNILRSVALNWVEKQKGE